MFGKFGVLEARCERGKVDSRDMIWVQINYYLIEQLDKVPHLFSISSDRVSWKLKHILRLFYHQSSVLKCT